ncbi:hypothetical protein Tco_0514755 [Tanacetum coccineum]
MKRGTVGGGGGGQREAREGGGDVVVGKGLGNESRWDDEAWLGGGGGKTARSGGGERCRRLSLGGLWWGRRGEAGEGMGTVDGASGEESKSGLRG